MSSVLSQKVLAFCDQYFEQQKAFEQAAKRACTYVERTLIDSGLAPYSVTARAKDHLSLLEKLRRKHYTDPAKDVTDLVGVRVITRFRSEVDYCAEALALRPEFDGVGCLGDGCRACDLRFCVPPGCSVMEM